MRITLLQDDLVHGGEVPTAKWSKISAHVDVSKYKSNNSFEINIIPQKMWLIGFLGSSYWALKNDIKMHFKRLYKKIASFNVKFKLKN